MLSEVTCHACRSGFLNPWSTQPDLARVTSDCRPARARGAWAVCPNCSLVQTVADAEWREDARRAYAEYAPYAAALGAEQQVSAGNSLCRRSEVLVRRLADIGCLPDRGRLLDVGCGNGAFVRAFASSFPGWTFDGMETNERHRKHLEAIPGFDQLYGVELEALPGGYAAVSLVHVLEHLEDPVQTLQCLRGRLQDSGTLVVQVPCWRSNPFALIISDHASHFTPDSLARVSRAAGWETVCLATDWVPKEITLVGRVGKDSPAPGATSDPAEELAALQSAVQWLSQVMNEAREIASASPCFGLFGSAIAATWLQQGLGDRVRFFVDEDPNRVGGEHLGLPILSPSEVPDGADVFLGISPLLVETIRHRLRSVRWRLHGFDGFHNPRRQGGGMPGQM